MRQPTWILPATVLAILGAACSGTIGEADPGGKSYTSTTPPGTDATGTQLHRAPGALTPLAAPDIATLCEVIEPGPTFIRRLTRFEYNNTVRDLLGDTSGPASEFPAEETKFGFDNNAEVLQVSADLAQQYMLTSEKIAATAVANLSKVLPCDPAKVGVGACRDAFIASFLTKAYRRKATADELKLYAALFDAGNATDFATGIRLIIETVLQSPPFLYRVEFGPTPMVGDTVTRLTSYETASRLSYLLWGSMPDDELLAQAEADALQTPEQIRRQVARMIVDSKSHDAMAHFNAEWLKLDAIGAIQKDASAFPDFPSDLAPALAESTRRFVDDAVWHGAGTLESLLLTPVMFVNPKLATFYGLPQPSGTDFQSVPMDPTQRAGLLTQPGIMATLAKANQTSPIHRGKFVREQLLCNSLPAPPKNFTAPDLSPTLSTRDRFSQHRSDPACNGCHQLMDPIGFGFEHYDGIGRYRELENGQKVDATGEIKSSDVEGPYDGALALSKKLASSDQVRACVATSWFQFAAGRSVATEDACSSAILKKSFRESGYKLSSLLVVMTETDSFLYRRVVTPGGAQ